MTRQQGPVRKSETAETGLKTALNLSNQETRKPGTPLRRIVVSERLRNLVALSVTHAMAY